jgi:hypothetical protein
MKANEDYIEINNKMTVEIKKVYISGKLEGISENEVVTFNTVEATLGILKNTIIIS